MDIVDVGIDVSKGTLEVGTVRADGAFSCARRGNTPEGIAELVRRLPEGARVHLEASGGYERPLRYALLSAGIEVWSHNPRRVRRLADAKGFSAKTDRIDARVLCHGSELPRPTQARGPAEDELADFSRRIETVKEQAAAIVKRLQMSGLSEAFRDELEEQLRTRRSEILRMERAFERLALEGSGAERLELARSVPGVGPALSRTLAAELPEDLSGWNSRQIAAYAGLAPLDRASGQTVRTSRTGPHGNRWIRRALYMPSMSCLTKYDWAKDHYRRLRAKGRSHRQAQTALMRRLLLQVFAVLKRGSAWQPEPPTT